MKKIHVYVNFFCKLKAFSYDKSYINQNIEFVFSRVENVVEKAENGGCQNF